MVVAAWAAVTGALSLKSLSDRRLRHGVGVQVARRDRTSGRRELADQLAAHARAAAGDHGEFPGEGVHRRHLRFFPAAPATVVASEN
jgi:hypothetical protein